MQALTGPSAINLWPDERPSPAEERDMADFFSRFVLPNNPTREDEAYLLAYLESNTAGALDQALRYYAETMARDPYEVLDAFERIALEHGGPSDRKLVMLKAARSGMELFAEEIGHAVEYNRLSEELRQVEELVRRSQENRNRDCLLIGFCAGCILFSGGVALRQVAKGIN